MDYKLVYRVFKIMTLKGKVFSGL